MRFTSGRFTLPGIILLGCALLAASVYGLLHSIGHSDKDHHTSQNPIGGSSANCPVCDSDSSTSPSAGAPTIHPEGATRMALNRGQREPDSLRYSRQSAAGGASAGIPEVEEMDEERREKERYDQPGEAAEFYRQKRLAEDETELPIEKYVMAMEWMRGLPVYSTLSKRLFPSRREMANAAQSPGSASLELSNLLDNWTPLGPGNVGGRTRALLIHPTNPDVIYAAAAAGGVWKTTDGGKSWKPLGDLLPNIAVNALAMDPQNPEMIYAGTGEGYFNSDAVRGAGIFRSFDGGATWRRLEGTGTTDFHYVNDIVISPTRSNRIYAATRSGVMRSLDGGATWTKTLDPDRLNGGCLDLAIRTDVSKDHVLAACGTATGSSTPSSVQSAIYLNVEAERGLSGWEVVYTEVGMGRTSLAIAPSNQNVVYAVSAENGAAGSPHSLHAVFRSTGGGTAGTWTAQVRGADTNTKKLNTLLFTNPIFALNGECYGKTAQFFHQGWYNNVIAVDPKDENIVWVGGIDLFRSEDGGVNWGMASFWHLPQTNSRYVHADHHAIVFHPRYDGAVNNTMYVGNDGGVYRTDNARAQTVAGDRAACSSDSSRISWVSLNNGYAVTQFYHGVPFPNGAAYVGGAQDNGVLIGSDDAGPNGWKEILPGDGGYVAVDWTNPKVIYAATTGLSLKKSTDGGLRFNPATTGVSNVGFNFIAPFTMDPSDPARLWMGGRQMWRTRNGAMNWSQASDSLSGSVTAIAVAPTDANFVLAGVTGGQIHRTTIGLNSGADTLWPQSKPRSGYVSSLTFDPSNRDVAYATYSTFGGKHVWRSLDGGVSWQAIDGADEGALPDIPVHCIIVDPTNTQRLYIGTDLGVFVSIDGGVSWAVENTGFANVPVESLSLSVVGYTTYLFAFTHGRGVWRVTLGGACSSELSPTDQTINVEGGGGSVQVTASSADCQWTVESNSDWITIAGDAARRGSGVVTFNVAPNLRGLPRSGVITIAGKNVSVTQAGAVTSVSAASLRGGTLAPESIASAFGAGLATTTQQADSIQLPTALANTVVTVKDSAGIERRAPLFFVSPNQVNYQMPQGVADGPATVTVSSGDGAVFNGPIQIARVAPGLFTASSSGQGVAVGQALRVRGNGAQSLEPLALWDAAQSRFVANPIDLSAASEQVYLILYGTGWRHRSSLSAVNIKVGGIDAPALYAGAQGIFAGLDQINFQLPRSLAGRGEMDLILTVDGQTANTIRISVK